MDWWNGLTQLQRIFASIAMPATLFMVIQFVLLLFGFADGDGADVVDGTDLDGMDLDSVDVEAPELSDAYADLDFHGDPDIFHGGTGSADDMAGHDTGEGHDTADTLRLFSIKSIVAFLAVGGWMGVAAIDWKLSALISIILALGAGWLALYFVAWTLRAFIRMQQSGNVKYENAVGKEGEVYLTIPLNGRGKVNVLVQDRLCEIDAIAKAERPVKTGEKVIVIGLEAEGVLLVTPKSEFEKQSSQEDQSLLEEQSP